jgi:hypothetical protein
VLSNLTLSSARAEAVRQSPGCSPGLPPKIFSQIENIQSNPPFPPFHVSHEIAGCNTKSAPTTTPLRTSYLKIPVTSDHPLFLVLYDLLNHNHVICDIKTYKLDIK